MIWMIGLVLGGWIAIMIGFSITEIFWGILIVMVGVIYLFLRFFKRYEQQGTIGLLTLVELVNFICINGLISTFLWGGV
jgi:hypothetical protein